MSPFGSAFSGVSTSSPSAPLQKTVLLAYFITANIRLNTYLMQAAISLSNF